MEIHSAVRSADNSIERDFATALFDVQ